MKKNPKREIYFLLYGVPYDDNDPLSIIIGLIVWIIFLAILFG